MKHVKIFPLPYCCLTMLFLSACDEWFDPPQNEPELPPITQTGENTFGCMVNDELWVTKTSLDATAVYQLGFLQIGAGIEANDKDEGMRLRIDDIIEIGKTYTIDSIVGQTASARFTNSVNRCFYEYVNSLNGTITILEFTTTRPFIVAGTFEFTTVTEGCGTIQVTDGRFDLNYIP